MNGLWSPWASLHVSGQSVCWCLRDCEGLKIFSVSRWWHDSYPSLSLFSYHTNRPDVVRVAGKFDLLDRILPKLKRKGHRYVHYMLPAGEEIWIVKYVKKLLTLNYSMNILKNSIVLWMEVEINGICYLLMILIYVKIINKILK